MCTWALPSTVRDLAEKGSPTVKEMATTAIQNFRPLVTLLVFTPQGQLVARREANEDILKPLHHSFEEGLSRFLKFLADPAG